MFISQLEACQEGGFKMGVTWRTLRVPDQRPDDMDDLGGPQGLYPEGFVSLSLFLADI